MIQVLRQRSSVKEIKDRLINIVTNQIPIMLVEKGRHTVVSWSF